MRRFITELIISVMLISVGVSLCFFEFSDYDYVEYHTETDKEVIEYTVDQTQGLKLELDDDLQIHFEYDDSMKNRVRIEFSSLLRYSQKENSLKIKDLDWHWSTWKAYYQTFVNGLKRHEIVTFHGAYEYEIEMVTIICSKETREWIGITH